MKVVGVLIPLLVFESSQTISKVGTISGIIDLIEYYKSRWQIYSYPNIIELIEHYKIDGVLVFFLVFESSRSI